jgi:hypothetical protein
MLWQKDLQRHYDTKTTAELANTLHALQTRNPDSLYPNQAARLSLTIQVISDILHDRESQLALPLT